jgi:hypothetical protein
MELFAMSKIPQSLDIELICTSCRPDKGQKGKNNSQKPDLNRRG